MPAKKAKICRICKTSFKGRKDAKTCSPACRKRLQRNLQALAAQKAKRLESALGREFHRIAASLLPNHVLHEPLVLADERGGVPVSVLEPPETEKAAEPVATPDIPVAEPPAAPDVSSLAEHPDPVIPEPGTAVTPAAATGDAVPEPPVAAAESLETVPQASEPAAQQTAAPEAVPAQQATTDSATSTAPAAIHLENTMSTESLEPSAFGSAEAMEPADNDEAPPPKSARERFLPFHYNRLALTVTGLALLVITLIGGGSLFLAARHNTQLAKTGAPKPGDFAITNVSLGDVKANQLLVGQANQITINGQLTVNNTLVVAPTARPTSPVKGQIYYDQATNQPYYYDGTQFISLAPQQSVTSLGGASGVVRLGNGLSVVNNQLDVSAALTQQINSAANSGVLSLAGTANQVNVSSSTGHITLSLPQSIATTSSPTFGGLTLSNLSTGLVLSNGGGTLSSGTVDRNSASYLTGTLTVANGGTGAASFTGNGLIYGNGAGALQVTNSLANATLVTSAGGVPSLSQTLPLQVQDNITHTGVLNSGSITAGFGVISTVNNISTTALVQAGSLQVDGGTFTIDALGNFVSAGTGTIQGAGGLTIGVANTTTGSLKLANSGNIHYTILQGLAPAGTDQTITIPNSGLASDTVCLLTMGNCVGVGGAVSASGGIQNYITKFTNAGGTQIGNSLLFDNGTSVGVGTVLPNASYIFDINGNLHASGTTTLNNTLTVTAGGAGITGNILQTGTGTFGTGTGNVSLNGATTVTGTNTLNVGTGATTLGGTLDVTTGLTTLSGGASITNGATITGLTNINISGTANTFIGNATGTVNLTGATTVTGTLAVTDASSLRLGTASTATGSVAFKNATNANTLTLQSGATASNLTFTLPTADGSNGQCLQTNSFGVLSFNACTGGVGGGVTSLDGLTGVLTLANSSGAVGTVTIDNAKADASTKGIATFNATNFSDNGSGTINTIQNIATTSSPVFVSPNATTGVNTGAGAGTQRIDASGNLVNIGTITTSGAINTATISGGTLSGGNVSGGTLTATAVNSLNVSATAIAVQAAATGLTLDAGTTGTVSIGGTSTGDILLGGGSGSTGCTVTNSNGNLTCTGNITGAATGTVGYWSRAGTTLQPATAGDAVTTSGNISTTGTGTITAAGILNANATGKTAITIADSGAQSSGLTIGGDTNLYRSAANTLKTDDSFIIGGSQFTNNASTLNSAQSLGDFPAGGAIGTAATTVDIHTSFAIAQTTAGQILSLPSPTDTTAGRVAYVLNTGSVSFTMQSVTIPNGYGQIYMWNGTSWILGASGGGSAITLQSAYDGGNTLTTSNARDINVTLANTATDANFIVNVATGSTGQFEVQNNGTPVLSIGSSGNLTVTGTINTATISGGTLTATAVNSLNVSGTAISGTGALTVDANGANTVSIGATSTGDILLGGGSGSTGCTVTNSTGAFACTSTINAATITGGSLSGTAVNGLSVSGGTITNPTIAGTVTGSASPTITGFGTYNSQTISSAANFTGTVTIQGANALTLGTASTNTGAIVFKGSGGAGTLTLQGPTTPNVGNFTLSIPAITGNANICTDNSICSGYAPSSGGNYIAKNAADTSSASVAGNLLGLTNTNTGAAGVLSLTNSGTNSALSVLQSGTSEPSALQALILANNNTTTPTGNLLDLQNKGTSELHVDVSGNLTTLGNIQGTNITSTGTITVGTLGTTDTSAVLCRNSGNIIAACSGTSTGSPFVQGGNSFGTTATLGTNDNNNLAIKTNGSTIATFTTAGQLQLSTQGSAGGLQLGGDATLYRSAANTLTAQTLNATTGINTGATAGTQRIDASGNLVNIGNLTGTGAVAIAAGGAAQNITLDGSTTGQVQIGGVSTGDILLGGGSGSTGCTVTNATGDFTCTGNITGAATGTVGYWSRAGTTLQPSNAGDAVTTSGAISTTGSGTLSIAGTSTLTGNVAVGTTVNATRALNVVKDFGTSPTDQSAGLYVSTTASPSTNFNGIYGSVNQLVIAPANSTTTTSAQGTLNQVFFQGSGGAVTSLYGTMSRTGLSGASPSGTVTNSRALYLDSVANFASGSPSVTFTTQTGLGVANQGLGSGSGGLTIQNAIGIDVGAQTGATTSNIGVRIAKGNTYTLQLSDTGGTAAGGIEFGTDTALYRSGVAELTTNGDLVVQGGDITTNQTTFNLLNTTATTLNIGGAATTALNLGPTGATATSVNLAGGSAATGCTVDGATGNLACSGTINGAATGSSLYWNRTGTTLQPATAGDAITTTGNISTTSTGTITSAGLLTGNAGLTVTGGTANINATGAGATNIGSTGTGGAVVIQSASTIALTSGTTLGLTSTGSNNINITPGGGTNTGVLVKPTADSTAAFQIQNAAAASFFTADSTNKIITTLDQNVGRAANIGGAGRLFSDGFEGGSYALWSSSPTTTGTTAVDTAHVRNGKYSAKFTTATSASLITNINASSTVYARAQVYATDNTSSFAALLSFTSGNQGGYWAGLYRDPSGNLCLYYNHGGTNTCSSTVMPLNQWAELEVKVVASSTGSGSLIGYLNGTQFAMLTSANTTVATFNNFFIGDSTVWQGNYWVDDVAVDTVDPGASASLNVADSLHVSGTSSFGGNALFQPASDSTTAFQVQNVAGTNLLAVDTTTAAPIVNIGVTGSTALASTVNIATTSGAAIQTVNIGSNSNVANVTNIFGGNGTAAIALTPQTTGTIVIGAAAGTGNITLGSSTAAQTVLIGNGINASAQTVSIANGASAANSTVNILSGVGTAGASDIHIGNNTRVNVIDLGNIAAAAARQLNIGTGNNIVGIDTLNIGTGNTTVAGGKTINIGNGTPTGSGTNIISIGSIAALANTTTIQGGNGAGAVSIQAATSGTISVGTANANTLSIGNTTSGTVINERVGTSYSLDGVAASTYAIGASTTTGTITIGGTAQSSGAITLGSSSAASSVLIANGTGASTVSIGNATTAGSTVNIAGATTATGITDTVNIATGNTAGTGAKTVHIADGTPAGTGANTVTIGSGANASAVTLTAGTGNINLQAGTIVGNATTQNLFNTVATALNIGGAVTGVLNIGPTGATASTIQLAGGSAATGCTVDGATGNLACSGTINGAATGSSLYWNRTGTTLQPATAGDAITTTGNISTTSTGTITSAGLLTGNAGLTVTGGTANINATGAGATNIGSTGTGGAVAIQSASTIALTSGTTLGLTSTGSNNINITPGGGTNTGVLVKPTTDSTSAFQIQNTGGTSLLTADTTNLQLNTGNLQSTGTLAVQGPDGGSVLIGAVANSGTGANAMTFSGNEITDKTRATDTQGDGRQPPDSSTGIWEGTTNLVTNGGFESNMTGWGGINSGVTTRDTSTAKFGAASLKVVTPGSIAGEGAWNDLGRSTVSASTVYTVSAWVKVPAGKTVQLILDEFNGSNAHIQYDNGSVVTGTGSWQYITKTITTTGTTTTLGVGVLTVTTAQATTFWMDGVQLEQKAYATPYVETNGGTASRTGARVQAPAANTNSTQGWFATRIRPSWSSSGTMPSNAAGIYEWADNDNNRVFMYFVSASQVCTYRIGGGSGANQACQTISFSAGDSLTIVGYWTSTQVKMSANGSAFTAVNQSTIPTIANTTYNIGSLFTHSGAQQLDADIFWSTAGTGTLSDADAAALNRLGNSDPSLAGINGIDSAATPTFAWNGESTAYTGTNNTATLQSGITLDDTSIYHSGNGSIAIQGNVNSTTAFQVQNASGTNELTVDTTNQQVAVGPSAVPANSVLTIGTNTTAATGGLYFGTDTNLYRSAAATLRTDSKLVVANTDTTSTGGVIYDFDASLTASPSSPLGVATDYIGAHNIVTSASANTASSTRLFGSINQAAYTGAGGGTLGNLIGVRGRATDSSNGTVTSASSLDAFLDNTGTGTIQNAYGLIVETFINSGGGTITSAYGAYINAPTVGSTNNIGLQITGPSGGSGVNSAIYLSDTAGTAPGGIQFGNDATKANLYRSAASTLTTDGSLITGGDMQVQGGDITTNQTTFNLLNTTATTLNIGGAATTALNLGPTGATATSVNLAGGSAATGCTVDGATGNLACSGTINGAATGSSLYWNRTGTTLQPATAGDAITTTGNISTTSTGTITSAGLLTGNAGATISGGAINLNVNSSTNATNISTGSTTGTVAIGNATAGENLTLEAGTASTGIQIGNGTTAHGIQIGSNATGDNDILLGGANSGSTVNIEGGTSATAIQIGNGATAHGIQIGTAAAVQTIVIGSTNSTSALTLQAGTGNLNIGNDSVAKTTTINIGAEATGADLVALGSTNASSTLTLESGTGVSATLLFNGATAHTVQLATGAAVQGVTIGSTNSTSSLTLQAGTGNLNIGNDSVAKTTTINIGAQSTGADVVAVGSANASSTLTLEGGTTSTGIQIGNGATAHGIQIGSNATGDNDILLGGANSGSTVNIEAGTAATAIQIGNGATAHGIQIGTAAAVQTIVIGSNNSTSPTTIQAGTSGITLNPNGSSTNNGVLVKPDNDTTLAFQVQNAAATNTLLAADTTNTRVNVVGDVNVGTRFGNRLFSDNFESGGFGLWDLAVTGTISADTTTVHDGKYAAKVNPAGAAADARATIAANSTVYARAWVDVTSQTSANANVMQLYAGGGGNSWTVYRNGGNIRLFNSVSSVDLAGGTFSTGAWHLIEMRITTGAGSGTSQVWLDGTLTINGTSQNNGTTNISAILIGDTNSNTFTTYIDDLAVDTAANGTASSLNVDDSLHVGGTASFGNDVLIQGTSDNINVLQVVNSAGSLVLAVDTTGSALGGAGKVDITPQSTINFGSNSIMGEDAGGALQITNFGASGVTYISAANLRVQDTANAFAQVLNIGNGGQATFKNSIDSTTAFQVQNVAGTNLLAVDTTTAAPIVNIGVTGSTALASTVNIATTSGAAIQTVNIGSNSNVANVTNIFGGNGTAAIALTPQTTGTIVIGAAAGSGQITLGSSSTTQTTVIGGGGGVSTVQIAGGSAANVVTIANVQTAGSLSIGNAMTSGTIAIGGGSAVRTGDITIGSTGTTSGRLRLIGGTGTGVLGGSTSGIDIIPGTAGTINIGAAAGTGAITLGSSTAAQTVNVGTGASGANNQTVNVGTTVSGGAGIKAINIGSTSTTTNGLNTVTILAGNHSGSTVANASRAGTDTNSTGIKVSLGDMTGTTALCANLAAVTAPTSGTAYELIDCSGTPIPDYAEMYPTDGTSAYGDIMMLGTQSVQEYQTDGTGNILYNAPKRTVTQLVKGNQPYATNVIGVVSNNYGDFSSTGQGVIDPSDNPMPIALNGRVPVNISSGSAPIAVGDYITVSGSDPGKGMKATQAGEVVGKALEAWTPGSGQTQIMMYVEQGYYPGPNASSTIQNGGDASLASLNVAGNTTLANLGVTGATNLSNLNVSGPTTLTSLTVAGSATIGTLTVTGSAHFADNITIDGHIITAGGQPTSQPQVAAGGSATVSVDGTDTTGTITITTGSAPSAGDLTKILFSKTYGATPHIVLSPSNGPAAGLHFYKGATTATDFMFDALDNPAPNTTYTYDYFIAQ